MKDLAKQKCVPCEGGTKPLTKKEALDYLKMTKGWELLATKGLALEGDALQGISLEIQRKFIFKDFKDALSFVNKVGRLANAENHHPDIFIHNYKKVDITLSTHSIGGLSTNDFVMAAKINQLQ